MLAACSLCHWRTMFLLFFFVFLLFFFSFFFFFSSRRRHTRWNCDWSSDVCSSDLEATRKQIRGSSLFLFGRMLSLGISFFTQVLMVRYLSTRDYGELAYGLAMVRSEERRVGKEV